MPEINDLPPGAHNEYAQNVVQREKSEIPKAITKPPQTEVPVSTPTFFAATDALLDAQKSKKWVSISPPVALGASCFREELIPTLGNLESLLITLTALPPQT
jgi:hypothetical protein